MQAAHPPKPVLRSPNGIVWDSHDKRTDSECFSEFVKYQNHREDLYWALRTRVLTDKEMEEVRANDYLIVIKMRYNGCGSYNSFTYRDEEARREFNEALMMQMKIRLMFKGCK